MLSAVIFFPAAAGLVLAAASRWLKAREVKIAGIAASAAVLALSLKLLADFEPEAGFQFVVRADWLPYLGASYFIGLDGISLAMVLLTAFLTPLALLSAWSGTTRNEKFLTIMMLFLESAVMGVFSAMDLFLFYVFWEASLIPMYFIIGVWGGPRRVYSAVKFFLFTMAGGALMFAAVIAIGLTAGTFSIPELSASPLPVSAQFWLFWAFFLGFAVKVPLVPVHTWLPDAHVEAPTAGSVILAGVLLKLGGYGLIRICAGMFPDAAFAARLILVGLGVGAILYGAAMVMVQKDLKRLVAYSSVSHMGYVVAGVGTLTAAGISGGVVQMVSHGFISAALFAIVGMLYERTHTRDLDGYGGVSSVLPHFSWAFLLVTLGSMGVPGTSGFVGEFMVLLGLAHFKLWTAVAAVGGVILGAVYMLTMFRRVMHGPVEREHIRVISPLNIREGFILACFAAAIVGVGVYPYPWLKMLQPCVALLVKTGGN